MYYHRRDFEHIFFQTYFFLFFRAHAIFFFFYGLKINSEKTKHQPVMLGREKDVVVFYLEAQSGKIEMREP